MFEDGTVDSTNALVDASATVCGWSHHRRPWLWAVHICGVVVVTTPVKLTATPPAAPLAHAFLLVIPIMTLVRSEPFDCFQNGAIIHSSRIQHPEIIDHTSSPSSPIRSAYGPGFSAKEKIDSSQRVPLSPTSTVQFLQEKCTLDNKLNEKVPGVIANNKLQTWFTRLLMVLPASTLSFRSRG
jgi:hypothetical protein